MTMHTTVKKHSMPNFEARSVLLLAALSLGVVMAARAQTPAAPPANSTVAVPHNKVTTQDVEAAFKRADADKDGKLSREEAEHFPALAQRFDQIDANRDRFISREEFLKAAGS